MSSLEGAKGVVDVARAHGAAPSRGAPATRADRRLGPVEPASIVVAHGLEPARRPLEKLIERVYARSYDAVILEHYPSLFGVLDRDGEVIAAAGFRAAARQRLFLEAYLPLPVEQVIAARTGVHLKRAAIVEVGNLVATGRRASLLLFGNLAALLHRAGCSYVVATATRSLKRSFDRLGVESVELGLARPEVLPDHGASWGSYYRHQPRVLAGPLAPARARLARLSLQSPARDDRRGGLKRRASESRP